MTFSIAWNRFWRIDEEGVAEVVAQQADEAGEGRG